MIGQIGHGYIWKADARGLGKMSLAFLLLHPIKSYLGQSLNPVMFFHISKMGQIGKKISPFG